MKAKISIALLIIFFGTTGSSVAQLTAYANIYATVVAPVGISDLSNENLGTIVVARTGNSTSLSTTNTVTASGIQIIQNGTATIASFSVTDYYNTTFDITLPSSNINLGNGHDNLIASNFSSNYTLASGLTAGKKEIIIGADLHIPENGIARNFNAQNPFPVTLNYN